MNIDDFIRKTLPLLLLLNFIIFLIIKSILIYRKFQKELNQNNFICKLNGTAQFQSCRRKYNSTVFFAQLYFCEDKLIIYSTFFLNPFFKEMGLLEKIHYNEIVSFQKSPRNVAIQFQKNQQIHNLKMKIKSRKENEIAVIENGILWKDETNEK